MWSEPLAGVLGGPSQRDGLFPAPAFAGHVARSGADSPHLGWLWTTHGGIICPSMGSRHPLPIPLQPPPGEGWRSLDWGCQMFAEWSCLWQFSNSSEAHDLTEPMLLSAICRVRVPLSLRSPGKTLVLLFITFTSPGTRKNLFPLLSTGCFADSLSERLFHLASPPFALTLKGGPQVF